MIDATAQTPATAPSAAEVLRRAQDRIAVLNGPGSMLIGERTDGAVFVAQDAKLICDLHNALQAALAAAQPATGPLSNDPLIVAQPAPAPATDAELWGVLESVHGDLAAALKASSISSALTQQYMGSAFDTVTDALACKEESAPTAPAPASADAGLRVVRIDDLRPGDRVLRDEGLNTVASAGLGWRHGDPYILVQFETPNRYGDTEFNFIPGTLAAVAAPAPVEGMERVTVDKEIGGLTVRNIPAYRDPQTGEVFLAGEAAETLWAAAEVLEKRGVVPPAVPALADAGLRERVAELAALADTLCGATYALNTSPAVALVTEVRPRAERLAEGIRALLAHPTPPAGAGAEAEQFCECPGFTSCVEQGLIKRADHQLYNSQTGTLRQTHYYFIGPKGPKGAIIAHCPSCGRLVKANRDFLALAQAQAEGGGE